MALQCDPYSFRVDRVTVPFMRKIGLLPGLAAALLGISGLVSFEATAQDNEEDLIGEYGPVELRRKEPNDLIDTSAQYNGLFDRRNLLHKDPEVLRLVRRIGHELAPAPTDSYINFEFYVVRDPSPNAFAFPNGDIYVHTGMLARMADESQLAALLAHEINHVAGHHTILSHRITVKRLAILVVGGDLASILGQLRYSRRLEQEADDRAPVLMEGSSWDPHGMAELLEILDQDFEGLNPRYGTIWMTHPDPQARIDAAKANVAGLPMLPRDPDAFDDVVYPLRALTVRDYIQDDYPYTAIAVAEEFLERYPNDLEFRMLLGDAWRVLGPRNEFLPEDFTKRDARRNLRRRVWRTRDERMEELLETPEGQAAFARNLAEAKSVYDGILERDPNYVVAHRGLAEVYEAQGDIREAGREYLTYLRAAPDAVDRPVIMGRLTAIRDSLQQQEAGNEPD